MVAAHPDPGAPFHSHTWRLSSQTILPVSWSTDALYTCIWSQSRKGRLTMTLGLTVVLIYITQIIEAVTDGVWPTLENLRIKSFIVSQKINRLWWVRNAPTLQRNLSKNSSCLTHFQFTTGSTPSFSRGFKRRHDGKLSFLTGGITPLIYYTWTRAQWSYASVPSL